MSKGIIFDIKELTVHDGPGVRTTVFFKGCPLRCRWCHNPEGWLPEPQTMKTAGGEKICGEETTTADLAAKLKKNADIFLETGGGITVSGGEPLFQPEFLLELLERLKPVHTAVQTSGQGDSGVFEKVVESCGLVLFDLKQMSTELHKKQTGMGNELILRNLEILINSQKRFVARMPMIPGVNITEEHFRAAAQTLLPAKDRVSIEILPYNPFTGAKYPSIGLTYAPPFPLGKTDEYPTGIFDKAGLPYKIL